MWKEPTVSLFAVAESPNGIDNFRFWEEPITMPETDEPATNIYDMRLTAHEWLDLRHFVQRKDKNNPDCLQLRKCRNCPYKGFEEWERLPDLQSKSQQRNVVLHPEFVDGKYAFILVHRTVSLMPDQEKELAGHWLIT